MAIQDERKRPKPPVLRDDFGNKIKEKDTFFVKKTDTKKEALRKLARMIAVFILFISMLVLADYYYQDWKSENYYKDLNNKVSGIETVPQAVIPPTTATSDELLPRPLLPRAEELLKENPDTVGWIEVPNTKISYPVVLRKGAEEGNEYYLARKFNGEQARAGTIFVDYRTTIQDRKQSDNLVLYGHNEINNTMFGDLDLYKNENAQNIFGEKSLEFYKQNPTFTFDTNYEEATYKIFAVFITPIDQKWDTKHDIFDYNNYIDFDEARYDDFIKKANERSRIKTDIDTKFGDKFVTLSTCSREFEDSRLVVIGRKVRPGENPTVNLEKVDHNEDAIELDWDTIYAK